jgi:hypothetical protein
MFSNGPQSNPLPSADRVVALENRKAAEPNNSDGIFNEFGIFEDDGLEEFEPDEDDEYGDSVPFDVPPLTGGPGTVYG